jgi:hypothetical protein
MTNLVTLDQLVACKGLTPGASPLFDADTLDVSAGHTPQHVVIHAGGGAAIRRTVDAMNPIHEPLDIAPPKGKDAGPVNEEYPLPSRQAMAAAGGLRDQPEGRPSGLPEQVVTGKGGTSSTQSERASKRSSSRGKAKTQSKASKDARGAENRVSSDETKTTTSTAKSETPASARTDPGQASAAPKPVEAERGTGRPSGEVPKPDEGPTRSEVRQTSRDLKP